MELNEKSYVGLIYRSLEGTISDNHELSHLPEITLFCKLWFARPVFRSIEATHFKLSNTDWS